MSIAIHAFNDHTIEHSSELEEVWKGLSETQKRISPKYFYDKSGVELFRQATYSKEYYLTRAETSILKNYMSEISYLAGEECHIIEYGLRDIYKTKMLLKGLYRPLAYTPIDFNYENLQGSCYQLKEIFPDIKMLPIYADFSKKVEVPLISELWSGAKRIIFFPGSAIGELDLHKAINLLKEMRLNCLGGALLIGADLIKDVDSITAAYNDSLGTMARFNLSILKRLNHQFHSNFDLNLFEHRAFFNTQYSRIEMHLKSLINQKVNVGGKIISFEEDETIHTKNCYKYSIGEFYNLVQRAGFIPIKTWLDNQKKFSLHYFIDSQKIPLYEDC